MNLVELRNKASEAMSVLGRKVRRIAEMDGKELGRNGGEVASSVEGILAEWDRYSEVKRQVASARSAAIIKKLGISFTEADMLCRDIDDQIEFLDTILDKIDSRVLDADGQPMAEPHILICGLRAKVEELSQMRSKIRTAAESCEHEIVVVWYDDDDVEDLMRVSVSKRSAPAPEAREVVTTPSSPPVQDPTAPKKPAPLPAGYVPPHMAPAPHKFSDESCPVCASKDRDDIERHFVSTKYNIMTTLDRAVSSGLLPRTTVPNDLRLHFDKHVDGIAEMEER